MKPHVKSALHDLARHSEHRVWTALLKFCSLAGSRGSLTEDDAQEVYDIVRRDYDRKYCKTIVEHQYIRLNAIKQIKQAINSKSN